MKRNYLFYPVIIGIFGLMIWFVIAQGEKLVPENVATQVSENMVPAANEPGILQELTSHMRLPLSMLLVQIVLILGVSRLFGALARKIKQPAVVGEILAGILLGPSLFGMIWPEGMNAIFPKSSLSSLQFLSQIGLAFFMFIVGMELDVEKIRNKAHDAVMISHASIVVPFFLGVTLAYFIYQHYAPANVGFLAFSLFMGIAMSITAFPVLARIVQERKLTGTPLGTLAITCAAADDVTAWCILAAVVAIAQAGSILGALVTIGLSAIFVVGMLYIIKPWLRKRMVKQPEYGEKMSQRHVALAFFTLLIAGYIAEIIGIHMLFGAFLAGVIMPSEMNIKQLLTDKLEDVSILILLPIFFAFTGLRTQIGLLNEGHLWVVFGFIMLVAVGGKFGGSTLSARLVGQPWSDAISIGALMNTRGLMELVVLNIGYDLGILTPQIFAMMVLMALATTFMTGPILDAINYAARRKAAVAV
ncbi:cation:proton antiporter [Chitinophaga horti]|uniref:Cation:proton antiporter n=1 Tax=Chitinophaga horti TaxID=2920382 RepID=A0ABY6J1T5_9BACT|nr:cation:proton antiporter [Chitinophaga horti]UYQ93361.1 cation:proton antiporter [Chitinophaga horti]